MAKTEKQRIVKNANFGQKQKTKYSVSTQFNDRDYTDEKEPVLCNVTDNTL